MILILLFAFVAHAMSICLIATPSPACTRLTNLNAKANASEALVTCLNCAFEACARVNERAANESESTDLSCANTTALVSAWTTFCAGAPYDLPLRNLSLPMQFDDVCVVYPGVIGSTTRCQACSCQSVAAGTVIEQYTQQKCGSCCGPATCTARQLSRRCLCRTGGGGGATCEAEARLEDEHIGCDQVCERYSSTTAASASGFLVMTCVVLHLLVSLFA